MQKSAIILFSALAVSATTASAADLGRPAPAKVDYVKVCDAYGEGFFYIPGTETCLKLGGYVRAEYRAYSTDFLFDKFYGIGAGTGQRGSNSITTRARANLQFDARTNTEYGLLRSYAEVQFTVSSGTATVTELQKAYIQFGGLTAGRALSFFDFYTGDHFSSVYETAHSDSIVNLLAYTFSFGNGVTATLSLEDQTTGVAARRYNSLGAGPYAGNKTPDVVGALKVDQAWGSAQVMAAAHRVYGTLSDTWGYAAGAGVSVKLPMIAQGDVWSLQAAYGKGALSYVSPDLFVGQDYIQFGPGLRRQDLSTAWSIASGFTHNWNAKWSTGLTASYADVDHRARFWDYSQFDIGANLVWAPVSGLTIGAEVEYKDVDFDLAGRRDRDALVGLLRIQRNF
ncbi:porin [Prosthecomicrobium sp. N25]|uniref:porin n=1 Tax=Prosthecomicrobium sp. N25 TaxID=3129254 RepID=UPI0030774E3C